MSKSFSRLVVLPLAFDASKSQAYTLARIVHWSADPACQLRPVRHQSSVVRGQTLVDQVGASKGPLESLALVRARRLECTQA